MKIRYVVIDEAIHIENKVACDLWRKTLWAKEAGYRDYYSNSILPMGSDDFFATHFIVANELPNGLFDPVVMVKSVRLSQSKKFGVPFGGQSLLRGTSYEQSNIVPNIIDEPGDISYESSWTVNPKYKTQDRGLKKLLKESIGFFMLKHHEDFGCTRWLTAGVREFKIDQFFQWLGGVKVHKEFSLPMIDDQCVQMFYNSDVRKRSLEVTAMLELYQQYWIERLVFRPNVKQKQKTVSMAL